MLNYYLPTYQKCLQLYFQAKKQPFRRRHLWLELQEKLIIQITRIENRIRSERSEIKQIKAYLGNRNHDTTKQEASELKAHIQYLKDKIDFEYKLLFLYRSIGDGIAFIFIDRHDIKPQAEKETAGFISGKKGNRAERKTLRLIFKLGAIGLLNDLTNYLRFSDLTVIEGYYNWFPVEIKSGRSSANNARALRQANASEQRFEYILDDATMEIPGTDVKRSRVEPLSKIKDYRSGFNKLLEIAKHKGGATRKMEEGLYYMASYTEMPDKKILQKMEQPKVVLLNSYKDTESIYFPLLMHFDNIERYMEFIRGELVIMIFFDIGVLVKYAKQLGYTLTMERNSQGAYQFMPDNPNLLTFEASSFAVGKIFFQLYSPKWWVNETILALNAKYPNNMKEA